MGVLRYCTDGRSLIISAYALKIVRRIVFWYSFSEKNRNPALVAGTPVA